MLADWDIPAEEWGVDVPEFEAPTDPFEDEGITAQDQFGVIVMCANAEEQEVVFNELTEAGKQCKIVVT